MAVKRWQNQRCAAGSCALAQVICYKSISYVRWRGRGNRPPEDVSVPDAARPGRDDPLAREGAGGWTLGWRRVQCRSTASNAARSLLPARPTRPGDDPQRIALGRRTIHEGDIPEARSMQIGGYQPHAIPRRQRPESKHGLGGKAAMR